MCDLVINVGLGVYVMYVTYFLWKSLETGDGDTFGYGAGKFWPWYGIFEYVIRYRDFLLHPRLQTTFNNHPETLKVTVLATLT
jgi:hypothetical protein